MPQMELNRFLKQIGDKPPVAVVLLGEETYLRDVCRKRLIEAHVTEATRQWAVTRFSLREHDLHTVLQQAQTMPMLAPRQVVVVDEFERLEKLPEEKRESAVEALRVYLADPAPFTVLVLEASQLDERMKLAKLLNEKATVVRVELNEKDTGERIEFAATLIQEMASEAEVSIDPDAARKLADCLDGALASIRNEVQKLAAYVGAAKRITAADVEAVVVSGKKYSVWQLAEILVSGQRPRALLFLDSVLREGEEPAGIVGALVWMYRKLLEAQELPAHINKFQAAGRLHMRPDSAEVAIRQSRSIPRPRLLAGIEALAGADRTLKSGRAANPRAVMEFLVTGLTAPHPRVSSSASLR